MEAAVERAIVVLVFVIINIAGPSSGTQLNPIVVSYSSELTIGSGDIIRTVMSFVVWCLIDPGLRIRLVSHIANDLANDLVIYIYSICRYIGSYSMIDMLCTGLTATTQCFKFYHAG